MTLAPRFDILPPAQRALWPALRAIPAQFVLYGGTALALRLGHRISIDFDFFSHDPLDQSALDASVAFLAAATTLHQSPNTRTVLVATEHGDVKVSLFGGIAFGRVGEPEGTEDGVLRVASLLDLGGTKVKALLQRVEAKDYLDVAALIDAGVTLDEILGAAVTLFGAPFNPLVARKALAYFDGGDLATLDESVRNTLVSTASAGTGAAAVGRRSARLD